MKKLLRSSRLERGLEGMERQDQRPFRLSFMLALLAHVIFFFLLFRSDVFLASPVTPPETDEFSASLVFVDPVPEKAAAGENSPREAPVSPEIDPIETLNEPDKREEPEEPQREESDMAEAAESPDFDLEADAETRSAEASAENTHSADGELSGAGSSDAEKPGYTPFEEIRGGGGRFPMPEYPRTALKNRYEGSALVEIIVGTGGSAASVEVLDSSGYEVLDEACVEIIMNEWRFEAASEIRMTRKRFNFTLK